MNSLLYNNRAKQVYNVLNVIIFACAAFLFVKMCEFIDFGIIKNNFIPLIFTVLFVHIIKCFRLYVILHKTGISVFKHIKTYCKVTPVSILFPFKLGELFRIYCYGYIIKDYIKSTIIILLDRFMDTLALLTIMAFIFLNGGHLTIFVYLLFLFIVFLLFMYKNFPKFYEFWTDYHLSLKADSHNLRILKYLKIINQLHNELKEVVQGSGFILFILSVIAWVIEIINLILLSNQFNSNVDEKISEYLLSALNLNQSFELNLFILFSISACLAAYLLIKLFETVKKGEQ